YYENDDESVLPRAIASRDAFENAVALDVAMGGSTNTGLHLLAAARAADRGGVRAAPLPRRAPVSRRVPCLSKVAPNSQKYHMEDVHRAGGIPALLGELNRGGTLRQNVRSVHSPDLGSWLDAWDIRSGKARARPPPGRRAGDLGHPQRQGERRGAGALPRRPRRRADPPAVLHHQPLG